MYNAWRFAFQQNLGLSLSLYCLESYEGPPSTLIWWNHIRRVGKQRPTEPASASEEKKTSSIYTKKKKKDERRKKEEEIYY